MDARLVTVADAVDLLDVPPDVVDRPRWLRRHLRAAERRTGRALLVRVGAGQRRPTYRVDLEATRLVCPELFSIREPLARALEGCATVGRAELSRLRELVEEVALDQGAIVEALRRMESRLTGRATKARWEGKK